METDLEKLNEAIKIEETNELKAQDDSVTFPDFEMREPDLYIKEAAGISEGAMSSEFEQELFSEMKELYRLTESIEKKKEQIKAFIETNKLGSFNGVILGITYNRATTATSIDTKALKAEMPDIAAKYSKVSARSSSVSVKVLSKSQD